MSIEHEIDELIVFLSHPAGFEISIQDQLSIVPLLNGDWEVRWFEDEGHATIDLIKVFTELNEAVKFFVERRHYLTVGQDFDQLKQQGEDSNNG
jgi:hypothetical protein